MPERFGFPPRGSQSNGKPAAFFVPIAFSAIERQNFGGMYNNSVVARLKPGVSVAQAHVELEAVVRTLAERYPPNMTSMARRLTLPMWPHLGRPFQGRRNRLASVVILGSARRCASRERRALPARRQSRHRPTSS